MARFAQQGLVKCVLMKWLMGDHGRLDSATLRVTLRSTAETGHNRRTAIRFGGLKISDNAENDAHGPDHYNNALHELLFRGCAV